MRLMPFKRPTDYYDERVKQIDEKICKLIKQRKEISNQNPGYPPFEYISNWAKQFDLYEDLLKSIFGSLWNEKMYRSFVEPKIFQRNLPLLKSIEIDNRLFSVISIRQYSNCSILSFNIDWDSSNEALESQQRHNHFELFIDEQYHCRMSNGSGGDGHYHYNFIISPALPEDTSGIKLTFKEYNPAFRDETIDNNIVIQL